MPFFRSKTPISFLALFGGLAILIFSAFSLVLPSGYSYGPALLVLGSLSIIFKRNQLQLNRQDYIFILILLLYFLVHVFLNLVSSLPLSSYDGIFRFLLVIPVYIFLIAHPPRQIYFWLGLAIGALGAGIFAISQKYFSVVGLERASGYINAIQFGDISLLIASLLLCGVVWAIYSIKQVPLAIFFFIASLFGFIASFLSISRGGWLAIPAVLIFVYKILQPRGRKIFVGLASILSITVVFGLACLPKTSVIKQRITQVNIEVLESFRGEGNDASSVSTRLQMWKNGVIAFQKHPFIGWGDLSVIKKNYPLQWETLNSIDNFNHLHNEYIDALAKYGLLGFVSLMVLYLVPLKYFLNLIRSDNKNLIAFSASGILLILCVMAFGLTQTFMAHISGATIFSFYLVVIQAYCRNMILSVNNNE